MTTTMTKVMVEVVGVAAAMAIGTHHHRLVHIRQLHRMHPKNSKQQMSISPSQRSSTTMPSHCVISIVKIYCRLPFYYPDHGMRRPMNWTKCYNHQYRLVTYCHVHCVMHHWNHVYFDSISIDTIHVIVPFVRCYNVDVGLPIRIQFEIICASSTPCNGPRWRQCAHRAAHSVVWPILNDQFIENAFHFVFVPFYRRARAGF